MQGHMVVILGIEHCVDMEQTDETWMTVW